MRKILSLIYELLLKLRLYLYKKGIFKIKSVPYKVICIGSITMGGAGKTPLTIFFANLFKDLGFNPIIVSRGYKRESDEPIFITPEQDDLNYKLIGDEPLLIHEKTKCHLAIHKNRFKAIELIKNFPIINPIIIMDDGFQYVKLRKDFNIISVNNTVDLKRRDIFPLKDKNDGYIGSLRDLPERLSEADIIMHKGCLNLDIRLYSHVKSYVFKYKINEIDTTKKYFAFSAIADNNDFFMLLIKNKINLTGSKSFPDHHDYNQKDIDEIEDLAKNFGADCLITTEKDFVKIKILSIHFDVVKTELELYIENKVELMYDMKQLLKKKGIVYNQ